VSRQISELEQHGLIKRTPSKDDGRSALITVTPRGRAVARKSHDAFQHLIDTITEGWTERQMASFAQTFRELLLGIEAAVWPESEIPSHIATKLQTSP
jgi:DNA-binding MarR family transcriptional regulator